MAAAQAWLDAWLRAWRNRCIARLLIAAGLHPNTHKQVRRAGWRRGSYVRMIRARTG